MPKPADDTPFPYSIQGTGALSDLVGDFIVYRNLVPANPRLPSIHALRGALGLRPRRLPHKSEPEYGQVTAQILTQARQLTLPSNQLRKVIFLGDTRLLDVTALEIYAQPAHGTGGPHRQR